MTSKFLGEVSEFDPKTCGLLLAVASDQSLKNSCCRYPMHLNDKFRLMLATTLRDDGLPDEPEYDPLVGGIFSLSYAFTISNF